MDLLLFFAPSPSIARHFLKNYGQHDFNKSIPALPGGVS